MKYLLYHGTCVGKDNLFLESFITTGALSTKTDDPWDQHAGLYVSPHYKYAAFFAHTVAADDAINFENPLKFGRGMLVEFEVQITDAWQIDHEMGEGDSIAVIKNLRKSLPDLAFKKYHPAPDSFTIGTKIKLLSASDEKDYLVVQYEEKNYLNKRTIKTLAIPWSHTGWGERIHAFFLEKIHQQLKKQIPEAYRQSNRSTLFSMIDEKRGHMKYTGTAPLPVKRILLRPTDDNDLSLDKWEVAYQRNVPHAKKAPITKNSSSPAKVKPAGKPPSF